MELMDLGMEQRLQTLRLQHPSSTEAELQALVAVAESEHETDHVIRESAERLRRLKVAVLS